MSSTDYEIDHIIPLAAGGSNDAKNLQLLCVDCHKDKTIQEKLDGTYKSKDIESSVFNTHVIENIINKKSWNAYQFVEKIPACIGLTGNMKPFKIDTKKCRRNILLHSRYGFPVYSIMDIPRPFMGGDLQCGMYYLEINQTFPFRGSGWYSQPIVEYGIKKRLIKIEEIKMEFIPSYTLPPNHFHNHINVLLDAFKDEGSLQKQSVNSMVGLFGKTKRSASKIKYTLEIEEAALWWGEKDPQMDVFIENIKFNEDTIIYKGTFTEDVEVEGMKYTIYKQILEMEALELHKLESMIIVNKGIVLDRNTDAIRYARKEAIDISSFYWDDDCTVPKYQNEDPKPLATEVLPLMNKKHELDYTVFDLQWKLRDDYLGSAEDEAKRIINSNESVHINGRAGTGKTYLVNKIIDELTNQNKIVRGFSPTNT